MISLPIYFADGSYGAQVTDEESGVTYVTDSNGTTLTGKLEYSSVPPAPAPLLPTEQVVVITTSDIPVLTTAQIPALG
jgi:hypothetical protein